MNPVFEEGLRILDRRAAFARILIVAVIATSALHMIGLVAVMQGLMAGEEMFVGDQHIVDLIGMISLVPLFASFVVVSMWIYRAHANLEAADMPGLEYTPGWSIGWFCIPFANLFKPFQAMRELWNASHGASSAYSDDAPGILWIWWLCWLLSGFVSYGAQIGAFLIASEALTIVSAGALYMIVDAVTVNQRTMDISATFA